MRTADDFNRYYATPDPWGVSRATFRDRVLRRHLTRSIRNKSVLELGCGEGHLAQAIFRKAQSVMAVDISDVAIGRAKSLNLRNARFETADLLDVSFGGYDVIAAIECIHFLSHREQGTFLERIARSTPASCFCFQVRSSTTSVTLVTGDCCSNSRASRIHGRQISQPVGLIGTPFSLRIVAYLLSCRSATGCSIGYPNGRFTKGSTPFAHRSRQA